MKACFDCGTPMEQKSNVLPDGMNYNYYYCPKCGDEILDMNQLHEVAELYRKKKKSTATISKWGSSLGVRIPKELVQKYKLKEKSEVTLIPEENGIRMII